MGNGVDVWVYTSVCGVWCNVANINFGFFNLLSEFMLLFGDLDRVSLFWDTFSGHSFGVMGINILDNWFNNRYVVLNRPYNLLNNRYYFVVYNRPYMCTSIGVDRSYNMLSIGVDNRCTNNSVDRVDQKLGISFWFSQSNGHKGKQSNESEHC